MLFTVIKKIEDVEKAITHADGLELRVDCLDEIDFFRLKRVIETCPIPIMLTLRKKSQGGFYLDSEEKREHLIEMLFSLNPDFFDLEYDMDPSFIKKISSNYPEVKIICSYHNFEKTPLDLSAILSRMELPFFYAYKLATLALSSLDAFKMMQFVKNQVSIGKKIIGICMGEKGQITRILGKVYGNLINYASIDNNSSTAPGQLSIEELLNIYNYKSLNSTTSIYALIGNPIDKSLGHFIHNKVIKHQNLNSVYLKIPIEVHELEEWISLIKNLNFQGFSVTMPLKEYILSYLDEIDRDAKKIGAANTVLIEEKKLIGFNTDGIGAIDALENKGPIQGKKVIIIGSGGAAKAIAYVATQRGAKVVILNRTAQKAKELADQIKGRGEGIEKMEQEYLTGYDILINCTPLQLPINPSYILPRATVMDIQTVPKESLLLFHAKQKGATVVYGYEMFINQAIAQDELWFKEKNKRKALSEIIESEVTLKLL